MKKLLLPLLVILLALPIASAAWEANYTTHFDTDDWTEDALSEIKVENGVMNLTFDNSHTGEPSDQYSYLHGFWNASSFNITFKVTTGALDAGVYGLMAVSDTIGDWGESTTGFSFDFYNSAMRGRNIESAGVTATTYTYSAGTVYHVTIAKQHTVPTIHFKIADSSNTTLWSDTLASTSLDDSYSYIHFGTHERNYAAQEIHSMDWFTYSINSTPTVAAANHSLEQTAVINQVGSANVVSTSYTTVLNGTFNVTNSTYAVGSWTVEIDNKNVPDLSCRGLIDGEELNSEVNRTFTGTNQLASLLLFSNNKTVDAGEHWAAVQCKKNSGSGPFTVSNTNSIIHILSDEQDENLTFQTHSLDVEVTSSSYQNLGTITFPTDNVTLGDKQMDLVFEGSINYFYTSEGNISFFAQIDGTNTTGYTRYGTAGSAGSGGGLYIKENVTAGDNVSFTLWGKSTSSDGNASINVIIKQFINDADETDLSNASGTTISTSWQKLETININNSDHSSANLVVKSVNSYISLAGDQELTLMLGNEDSNGTQVTRTISNGKPGVIMLQEVFQDVAVGEHEVYLWGQTDTGNAELDDGSTIGYVSDNVPFSSSSYEVRAFDAWDNTTITSFNVTDEAGTIFQSNASGIALVVPYDASENLLVESNNHFAHNELAHSTSTNLNVTLNQSYINFSAYQILTNITLYGLTYTVTDGTYTQVRDENLTFYLKAGNYNVTASKDGYFDRTVSFSVTALDDKTVNVTEMSDTTINFTAINAWGGGALTNFHIYNSLVGAFNTSGAYISVPAIQSALSFNLYKSGFANQTGVIITPNASLYNYTIVFYPENTINVRWYYEENGTYATGINISAEFISDSFSNNYTTETGGMNVTLTYPDDYTIRYSSPGFGVRTYFFTMTDGEHLDLNLSLVAGADNVTINVFDTLNNPLVGAYVKVLKFSVTDNAYNLVEIARTNFEGETQAKIFLNDEFYKFIVEYNGDTVLTTDSSIIYSSPVTLYANLLGSPFSSLFARTSLWGEITYTSPNVFTYTYTDGDGLATQGCLYAYRLAWDTETLVNSSCGTGAGGSTFITVDNTTGYDYLFKGYITKEGTNYYVTSFYYGYGDGFTEDGNGVLAVAILVLVFALIGFWRLEAAVIFAGLSVMLVSITGIVAIPIGYTAGIFALSLVAAFLISRRSS